jgi:hypothetical protein
LWVSAEQAARLSPTMVRGGSIGLLETDCLGDFLAPAVTSTPDKPAAGCFAEFQIDARQAGSYCVWARMRSPLKAPASFSFAAVEQGSREPSLVLANRDIDRRQWHWEPLEADDRSAATGAAVALKAGKFVFCITAREAAATVYGPMRWPHAEPALNPHLNLFCFATDARYVPTDADACRALGRRPGNNVAASAAEVTFPSLSAAQWRQAGKQPIPDWLRAARWYTKDSWPEELAYRSAGDVALLVRQIAACEGNAFRLSIFIGGQAYYQSRVAPHAPGLRELDYLREAVDEGRRRGVKTIVYMNPNFLFNGHPLQRECALRGPDGRVVFQSVYGAQFTGKALYACINHPRYRRFLGDVLREIFTEYRPDGLYVDGLSGHVCFCEHCRAKYREMFGAEMPVGKLAKYQVPRVCWGELESDPPPVAVHDLDARRLGTFLDRSLTEVTALFTRTVKSCRPDAAAIYHSYPKPDSVKFYDGTLTELYAGQPWVHLAWKFGELANFANVFPVPVFFNIYPHDRYTEAEARHKAFEGLANGVYPNFWSTPGMRSVFTLLRNNAEYYDFARTRPVRFPALVRDFRPDVAQESAPRAPGVSYAHSRFMAPYVGAYSALMRSGLPVVTLHRSGFERQLAQFRVLVLPNTALLSRRQVEAVREFVRGGGGLVCTHETSLYDEEGTRRADFGLADVLGVHYRGMLPAAGRSLRIAAPGHPVTAPLRDGALRHDEPLAVVEADSAKALARLYRGGFQTAAVPAILANQFGRGRVVYLPGRWCAMQCQNLDPAIERLFAAAVSWAAQAPPPVEVRATATVGVTLFDQPDRRIVHLLNYHRDSRYRSDDVRAIDNVTVSVAIPSGRQAERVHRLCSPADLPFQRAGGKIAFAIDRLGEYEAVAIELK